MGHDSLSISCVGTSFRQCCSIQQIRVEVHNHGQCTRCTPTHNSPPVVHFLCTGRPASGGTVPFLNTSPDSAVRAPNSLVSRSYCLTLLLLSRSSRKHPSSNPSSSWSAFSRVSLGPSGSRPHPPPHRPPPQARACDSRAPPLHPRP